MNVRGQLVRMRLGPRFVVVVELRGRGARSRVMKYREYLLGVRVVSDVEFPRAGELSPGLRIRIGPHGSWRGGADVPSSWQSSPDPTFRAAGAC